MAIGDIPGSAFTLIPEFIRNWLNAENFDDMLSEHFVKVKSGIRAALDSYLSKLTLFYSMSITEIFNRVYASVEDSHNLFLVLLVFSFGFLTTFVGVRARKLFVFYPFVTGCIYFLLIAPLRDNSFVGQAVHLYDIEAVTGMQNLAQLAKSINLHLIGISFLLASVILYFYSILKYIPALAMIAGSWSTFITSESQSTNYMIFAVFVIFFLYIYSKIFSVVERIVLTVIFSFVGSFILVTHINIANSDPACITSKSYDEFLGNFSFDCDYRTIRISNICSVLFILTFILGVWKQLEGTNKK